MLVSVREMKSHLSHYLAQARAGVTLEITSHRRVIARVTGVPEAANPALTGLMAHGAVQAGTGKPQGAHIALSASGKSVTQILLEDRG